MGKITTPGTNFSTEWGEPNSEFIGIDYDWDDMSKDMEDYYTGKSRYEKGKGWITDTLDESITRAIRKVLR